MFNFKLIKEHNENMNKAYSTISNYKGEKAAIINGVAKIFNAKKHMIIGYNELVDEHNKMITLLNNLGEKFEKAESIINSLKSSEKKLTEQKEKLFHIRKSVKTPQSYNTCVDLMNKRDEIAQKLGLLPLLNSYIIGAIWTTIISPWANSSNWNYSSSSNSSHWYNNDDDDDDDYEYKSMLDEKTKKQLEKKLNRIDKKIEQQPDFKLCVNIYCLNQDCNRITGELNFIKRDITDSTSLKDHIKSDKEKVTAKISKIQEFIKNESNILSQCNIDLNNKKLNKLDTAQKPQRINENLASFYFFQHKLRSYRLGLNSISDYKKHCNKYIDAFNIKDVEKYDISEVKEDNKKDESNTELGLKQLFEFRARKNTKDL